MIELILPIIVLLLLDIFFYLDKQSGIKFKNEILDLNINEKYVLNDIKSIFLNTSDFNFNIDEFSEYNIKRIQKYIEQVKGNLLKNDTQYYTSSIILGILKKLLIKQKKYNNDKKQLLNILNNIIDDLNEEKKFLGLNAREIEIFTDLMKNKNLSEADSKSILELKDIILNRYQELIKRDEQSDRLSKHSMNLGYISLIIAVISFSYSSFL